MKVHCRTIRNYLAAHLDGEATPLDPETFERHLAACEGCRRAAGELTDYLAAVSRIYPVERAPEPLERGLRRRLLRPRSPARRWLLAGAAGAAALAAAGLLVVLRLPSEAVRDASLADVAVRHHDAMLRGRAPLDIITSDPAQLVSWFADQLPFALQLPRLDSPDLRLTGARLVQVADEFAALVLYRKGDENVSLAVARAVAGSPPPGAEAEIFRNIRFHLTRRSGHNVISWTDRGLAYALVSDMPSQGRSSCVVCHAPGSGLRGVEEFHR